MQKTGNNLQKIYLGATLWERHETVSNESLLYTSENRHASMCVYGTSLVALILKNLPAMQKIQVQSLGAGNGYPLQYLCQENPRDRGTWWAIVHGSQRIGHDRVTKDTHAPVCLPT